MYNLNGLILLRCAVRKHVLLVLLCGLWHLLFLRHVVHIHFNPFCSCRENVLPLLQNSKEMHNISALLL
jgi:hypothetical protein